MILSTVVLAFAEMSHNDYKIKDTTQSRIIGAVRGAHSQLLGIIIPVCSPYAPRKDDKRFGTPAIV